LKNNINQKIISALLIISIILPSVVLFSIPKQANALFGIEDTVEPGPVWTGLLISQGASLNTTAVATTTTATATTTMAPSTLTNTATTVKNWLQLLAEQALRAVERQLLAKMTQATINWINSDFHGSPLFLENPESFFGDIAKSELKNVVNTFGYDPRTFPFGKQFVLNAINGYKSQLADNMGYTLSKVMTEAEAENYRNNFNAGGWNGFLINTQYPQNNYLGSQMQMTDYLAQKLQGTTQNAAQKVQSLLQQGMGFLSPQMCPSSVNPDYNNGINEWQKPSFQFNEEYNPPDVNWTTDASGTMVIDPAQEQVYNDYQASYNAKKAAAEAEWAKKNNCIDQKTGKSALVNTTPGSVAANQIFEALNVPIKEKTLTAAIGKDVMDSMGAIIDALLGHFIDKGLNALSDVVSGTPPVDNWSYNGITLETGEESNTGNTTGTLNIPQNVSVTVGKTTSTIISGGSGIYSIQPQSSTSLAIAVATIDISGSLPKLTITAGTTPGTTTIVIQDSSIPTQTITVTITVSAVGAIVVIPANISATTDGDEVIAVISGGVEPYSIKTSPNKKIAIAILSGTNLIVSSLTTSGTTFVDIKDSSSPTKTVRVNIIVSPTVLTITPPDISVKVGEVNSNLSISNGIAPYIITYQQDITIVNAEILTATPSNLTITGRALGTSTVTIKDSSNPAKTASVNITVAP
jgi:hypothetical protein